MQEKTKRNNEEWVRCRKCGHKLFRKIRYNPVPVRDDEQSIIEIKCHSCKEINAITIQ